MFRSTDEYTEIDQSWDKFRSDSLRITREQDERVIESWCKEIGFDQPIGYANKRSDSIMEIYTNRPGVLIGKGGSCVKRFKEILTAEFGRPYTIRFIEICGGFTNFKKINGGYIMKHLQMSKYPDSRKRIDISRTENGTTRVINYMADNNSLNTFLSVFDINGNGGQHKLSDDNNHAEVWFEMSEQFYEFAETDTMQNAFERFGLQKININHKE